MLEQKQVPVFFTRFNLWNKNIFPAVCLNYNTCIYCVLLGLLDMKYSLHAKNTNKIFFAGLPDAAAWETLLSVLMFYRILSGLASQRQLFCSE